MRIYKVDNIETIEKVNTTISLKNDTLGIFSLINEKFNVNVDINNNDINIYNNLSDVDILEKEIYKILLKNIVITKNIFTKKTGLIFYSNYVKPLDIKIINALNIFKNTNIPIIGLFKLDSDFNFNLKSIVVENYTKYLTNAGVIPAVIISVDYENENIDVVKYRLNKINEMYKLIKVIYFDDVSREPDIDYINDLTEYCKNIGYLYVGLKTNEPFVDISYYDLIQNVDNYIVKYDTSFDLDDRYVNYFSNINNNVITSKFSFSAIIHSKNVYLNEFDNYLLNIVKHFNYIYITNNINDIPNYLDEVVRFLENYNIRLKIKLDRYEPDLITIGLTIDNRLFVYDSAVNNIVLNTLTTITNDVANDVVKQYNMQSMNNYYNSLNNLKDKIKSYVDLKLNQINQNLMNEIQNTRNQIPRADGITIINNNNVLSVKDKGIKANHLSDNIDASNIGFNSDKVDGYDVDNNKQSNSLWTSDNIIRNSIITSIIFG